MRLSGLRFARTKGSLVDCHDLVPIRATDAARRSDPFSITTVFVLEPASVVAGTSSAAQGAARGEGCAIIFLPTNRRAHYSLAGVDESNQHKASDEAQVLKEGVCLRKTLLARLRPEIVRPEHSDRRQAPQRAGAKPNRIARQDQY
jgi:hypothetical protein